MLVTGTNQNALKSITEQKTPTTHPEKKKRKKTLSKTTKPLNTEDI